MQQPLQRFSPKKKKEEQEDEDEQNEEEQKKDKQDKKDKKDAEKKKDTKGKNTTKDDMKTTKMKKAKQQLLEKAKALEVSDEEAEADKSNENNEDGEEHGRYTQKAYYFRKLLPRMPPQVQAMFSSRGLNRKEKTVLVNKSIVKKKDGSWDINADAAEIQALSKHLSKITGKEKAKGIPKALMLAKLGGQTQLDKALQDGDVFIVTEKGKEFYVFQEYEIEKEQGTMMGMVGRSNKVADDSQLSALTAFVDGWQPSFGVLVLACSAWYIFIFHFLEISCFHF